MTTDVAFGSTGTVQAVIANSSTLVILDGDIAGVFVEVPLSDSAAALPVVLSAFTAD